MTLENYKKVCKEFAKNTMEWGRLYDTAHYTTWGRGYNISADNIIGGIDVSWAFHLSEEEIEQRARKEYCYNIECLLRTADDDEWNDDEIDYIRELISR